MKNRMVYVAMAMLGLVSLASCDGVSDALAPYEGHRPFELIKITQSYAPDIQWVGGRVAAVGVNRGDRAALDSTLLWVRTAPGDDIDSYVTVGQETDEDFIRQRGGTPLDSLPADAELTFWFATQEALDAGLDTTRLDAHDFLDTTFTFNYELRGRLRTQENVTVRVFRDQKLLSDRLLILWEPASFAFDQVALRRSSQPGFEDLVWHVQKGTSSALVAPLFTNDLPSGAEVLVEWPAEGLEPTTYTLWMTAPNWDRTFGIRANGLAYITFFSNSIL